MYIVKFQILPLDIRSLLLALASRDQMLENDGTSTWCPWWWSSTLYRIGSQAEGIETTVVLHPLPTSRNATEDDETAGQTVNQAALREANEFIVAQEEYVALPQLDGTDERSPDDHHGNFPTPAAPLLHYHASLLWLRGTLPWRGVKAVTARCAHVNPLRNFCDSAVFPQKPAATRIAVMNAVCAARTALWTTRVTQASVANCRRTSRPVPDTILQEIRGNLVELAAWRQIAEDPSSFAMAVKACDRAAEDLAASLREQLQLDRHPVSVRTMCDLDSWKTTCAPADPTFWSFHALYKSSIFLCPNDSQLHEALQKQAMGGKFLADSSLVSNSLHADLDDSVEVVEFSIPQWTTATAGDPGAAEPARVYIGGDVHGRWTSEKYARYTVVSSWSL